MILIHLQWSCSTMIHCVLALRFWKRGWSWSVSAMVSQAPVPQKHAGQHYLSSVRLATCWKSGMVLLYRWRQCEPRVCASPPSYALSSHMATSSPLTQTWCIWNAPPTIVRRTCWQVVQAPEAASATTPHPTQMAATSCAVAGVTTHTSIHASGSVTASSSGAALSSATPVVKKQRCSPANENKRKMGRGAQKREKEERISSVCHGFVLHIRYLLKWKRTKKRGWVFWEKVHWIKSDTS